MWPQAVRSSYVFAHKKCWQVSLHGVYYVHVAQQVGPTFTRPQTWYYLLPWYRIHMSSDPQFYILRMFLTFLRIVSVVWLHTWWCWWRWERRRWFRWAASNLNPVAGQKSSHPVQTTWWCSLCVRSHHVSMELILPCRENTRICNNRSVHTVNYNAAGCKWIGEWYTNAGCCYLGFDCLRIHSYLLLSHYITDTSYLSIFSSS